MGGRLIAGVLVDFISLAISNLYHWFSKFYYCLFILFIVAQITAFQAISIRFSRFKAAFEQNLKDSKTTNFICPRLLFFNGCSSHSFNYISYHLLEAPFHLSQTWIGLISIVYLAGIYSSPKAARWGYQYGRAKVLPFFLLFSMMVGLFITLIPSLWAILLGLTIFTFSFLRHIRPASSWFRSGGTISGSCFSLYLFCYYIGSSLFWE